MAFRLLEISIDMDIGFPFNIVGGLCAIGFLILFIVYVIHIFIEGLEKPTYIPTKIHNEIKYESATRADS